MAEPMDIDKGKAVATDGPSTSGKNFDLPWVSSLEQIASAPFSRQNEVLTFMHPTRTY